MRSIDYLVINGRPIKVWPLYVKVYYTATHNKRRVNCIIYQYKLRLSCSDWRDLRLFRFPRIATLMIPTIPCNIYCPLVKYTAIISSKIIGMHRNFYLQRKRSITWAIMETLGTNGTKNIRNETIWIIRCCINETCTFLRNGIGFCYRTWN